MSFFKQIINACYAFDKYYLLVKVSLPKVLFYLFVITLVQFIVMLMPIYVEYAEKGGITGIIDKYIPEFEIKDGVFYCEKKINYVDNLADSIIIVDSDKIFDEEVFDGHMLGIAVDKEKIMSRYFKTSVSYFRHFKTNGVINKNFVYTLLPFIRLAFIVSATIVLIMAYCTTILNSILVAVMAFLINLIISSYIKNVEYFKLAVYVQTMPVILQMSLYFIGVSMPSIVYIAVIGLYIYFALKNIKKQEGMIIAVV